MYVHYVLSFGRTKKRTDARNQMKGTNVKSKSLDSYESLLNKPVRYLK